MPTMKQSIFDFSEQLLVTKDIDPVYVILWEAKLPGDVLLKWLLAYTAFYHVGTASWITSQKDYWNAMESAARSKDYPRSSERRHYRAANAINSVAWLRARGVDSLFQPLLNADTSVKLVMDYVKTWVGYGPWIAFKVADIIERLGLSKVRFDSGAMMMFDSPREGAEMIWDVYGKKAKPTHVGQWATDKLLEKLGHHKAPPRYERHINVQECETCFCKFNSSLSGHYYVGKDIKEVRHGLDFRENSISKKLIQAGKVGELWEK